MTKEEAYAKLSAEYIESCALKYDKQKLKKPVYTVHLPSKLFYVTSDYLDEIFKVAL